MRDQAHRLSILKLLIAFSVLSTAGHFTHNFVEVDNYPTDLVSGEVIRVAILISWPLFTAIGLLGYRLYSRGNYSNAHACLLAYSFFGLTSLGHFLDGSPDIPAFWFGTIFTDVLAGAAILVFTLLSMKEVTEHADHVSPL